MRIPFNPRSGSRAFWLSHLVGATFLTYTRRLQSGLEPVQASKLVIQEINPDSASWFLLGRLSSIFFRVGKYIWEHPWGGFRP